MNEKRRSVRKRGPHTPAPACHRDRRVRRTVESLVRSLVALVLEKHYDAVTVQSILDRSGVGRSTFYTHYRSKDDLLVRSFEALLERLDEALSGRAAPYPRVAPVRELFAHAADFRGFHERLVRARMLDRVHEAGTERLARLIQARLARAEFGPARGAVPLEVLARAHAGALFTLLRWWLDGDQPYTPAAMDAMFHAAVWGRPR